MSQPVDCPTPFRVEDFLSRRHAPLDATFLHLYASLAKPDGHKRSRSSPGFVFHVKQEGAANSKDHTKTPPVAEVDATQKLPTLLGRMTALARQQQGPAAPKGKESTVVQNGKCSTEPLAVPAPRSSRSILAHQVPKADAPALKLEYLTLPSHTMGDDHDIGDDLGSVQLPLKCWPATDDESGEEDFQEIFRIVKTPVTFWPDTDDEDDEETCPRSEINEACVSLRGCLESPTEKSLEGTVTLDTPTIAEPAMLWPDTDSESSDFEDESYGCKLSPAHSWGMMTVDTPMASEPAVAWPETDSKSSDFEDEACGRKLSPVHSWGGPPVHGLHLEKPMVLDESTNRPLAAEILSQLPVLPGIMPIPGLMTGEVATTPSKSDSPPQPLEALSMHVGSVKSDSPPQPLEALSMHVGSVKAVESPKTTLKINELIGASANSHSPQDPCVMRPSVATPKVAPPRHLAPLGNLGLLSTQPASMPAAPNQASPEPLAHPSFLQDPLLASPDPSVQPCLWHVPPPPLQHGTISLALQLSVPPPPPSHSACASLPAADSKETLGVPQANAQSSGMGTRAAQHAVVQDSEQQVSSDDGTTQQGVTTLMVRNIPTRVMQKAFMQELDASGFHGLYDFCYLPTCFTKNEGKGFAFVNFISPAAAGKFVGTWHRSHRFEEKETALNISPAQTQGLEANKKNWAGPRIQRIRNPNLRPWIVDSIRLKGDSKAVANFSNITLQ